MTIQFAWAGWQAALEQPEQEPVSIRRLAEMLLFDCRYSTDNQQAIDRIAECIQRHTAHRKPLTDEEIRNLWDGHVVPVFGKNGINPIVFARAIEAAHGIKGDT